jgi:single-stranded-DNA-specific exonuclease
LTGWAGDERGSGAQGAGAERRFFLGVRRSAGGLAWVHRLDPRQEMAALAIAQTHGVPDIVARVLAGRGVPAESVASFLDPTVRDLMPDPSSLTDMDAAAARLADAVRRRERVAIFGDYDVDGAASSALLARFLRHHGIEAEIYIPDRIFEGYGPNPDAMRELVARGATLVVTVDCGTNSAAAIDAARQAGADVLVLDHHQVGGALPSAAVVNPNREDDLSGLGYLCAAGVVFMALVATSRELRRTAPQLPPADLLAWLDLVALATVCDVVPLVALNRAFVVKGLAAMRMRRNPGLAALAAAARIGEPLDQFHLGFVLGPRINAGGRIGDAALGSRLLATDDAAEAESIAATLERLNAERQAMERAMLDQAAAEVDAELAGGGDPGVVVAASAEWHPGIVGLLAARLKERTRRPAFAISFNASGIGTGSGRSIPGIDLGRLVREALAQGIVEKGGGHGMAAGITLRRERLGALRAFLERNAAPAVAQLRQEDRLQIDAAVSAEGATLSLVETLARAGPYGTGHAAPMFVVPRHRLQDVRPVGTSHLRLSLRSGAGGVLQAMAFRAADTELGAFLLARRGEEIHVAGQLSVNHWNGSRSIQLRVVDAAQASTV